MSVVNQLMKIKNKFQVWYMAAQYKAYSDELLKKQEKNSNLKIM